MKIALATCYTLPQLWEDDLLALPVFRENGIEAVPVVWDSPGVDWSRYRAVIIRSCWDYWVKHTAFVEWIAQLEKAGVPLWNPPKVIRWNTVKSYLQELEKKGVEIIPTAWIDQENPLTLAAEMDQRGWTEAVLKPIVSAGGHDTYRILRSEADAYRSALAEVLKKGTAMLQPFMPEILEQGEYSFLFYGGKFSHTVIKKGPPGEYRVQRIYGGTVKSVNSPKNGISAAETIIKCVESPLLYARVDMIERDGKFYLMELEVTEPNLFLANHPEAPERFVAAVMSFIAAYPNGLK